jgi:hypothetical protein
MEVCGHLHASVIVPVAIVIITHFLALSYRTARKTVD